MYQNAPISPPSRYVPVPTRLSDKEAAWLMGFAMGASLSCFLFGVVVILMLT